MIVLLVSIAHVCHVVSICSSIALVPCYFCIKIISLICMTTFSLGAVFFVQRKARLHLFFHILFVHQNVLFRICLYLISLITGWTVYTEKYKAQVLYEGPRDLYFSYGQSNQLLRSLLPDWNIQNKLGKVFAECKLTENSSQNVIIYRFRSFRKDSGNLPTIFRT